MNILENIKTTVEPGVTHTCSSENAVLSCERPWLEIGEHASDEALFPVLLVVVHLLLLLILGEPACQVANKTGRSWE